MSLLHTLLRLFCGCLPGGWRRQRSERSTPAGNPLPKLVHKVLQPSEIGPGRVIIVGDVHGCYDALLALLHRVKYQPRHDNLLLVGDLVGKGPKSQQVVAAVRAWCEPAAGSYCWVVRGNWDDAALAAGRYLLRGGAHTELPHKFKSFVHELLPEDIDFLTELPFSITLQGYNVVVVHAALIPGLPVEQQDLFVLTKVRDLVQAPDGRWIGLEQPDQTLHSQPWAGCWQGPGHCFFGHDAKRNLQTTPCATGLDTGCVYGRQLTACVLPPLDSLLLHRDAVSQAVRSGSGDQPTQQAAAAAAAAAGSMQSSQSAAEPASGCLPATPSFEQLRAELRSIPSGFVYDKKAAKKEAKRQKQ